MYNCDICGKNISEATYEQLDMKAGDSDQIICTGCIAKFMKEASVKVIAKCGKAALVMINWENDDEIHIAEIPLEAVYPGRG